MAILDGVVMMDSKHRSLNRRLYKYFLLIMLRKAGYNISAKKAGILAVKILQHKQEVEVRKRWLQVSYKNSSQFTQLKLILDRQKRKTTLSRFSFSASQSVVVYTKIPKGRLWGRFGVQILLIPRGLSEACLMLSSHIDVQFLGAFGTIQI